MDTNYTQNELSNAPPLMETKSHRAVYIILSIICYPLAAVFGLAGAALLGAVYLGGWLLEIGAIIGGAVISFAAALLYIPLFLAIVAFIICMCADPHEGWSIIRDALKDIGILIAWIAGIALAAWLTGMACLAIADLLFEAPSRFDDSAWEGPHLSEFAKDKFSGLKDKIDEKKAEGEQKRQARSSRAPRAHHRVHHVYHLSHTPRQSAQQTCPGGYRPVEYSPAYNPFNNGYNRYPNMQRRR